MIRIAFTVLVAACFLAEVPAAAVESRGLPDQVEALVARFEDVASRVFAAEIALDIRSVMINGKQNDAALRRAVWAFDLRKGLERQRIWDLNLPQVHENGEPLNCQDMLRSPNQTRTLYNWDWERSSALDPAHQGVVRAYTGDPGHVPIESFVLSRSLFLLAVEFRGNGEIWELRDFLNQSPFVEVSGDREVTARHPHWGTSGEEGTTVCTIGFAENGLMDRQVFEFVEPDLREKIAITCRATNFRQIGEDLFFPIEFTDETVKPSDGFVAERLVWKVSKLKLNDEVSETAFDFRFPENALVVELTTKSDEAPENYPLYLWGSDDKPRAKLASATELAEYSLVGQAGQRRGTVTSLVVIGLLAIIVVVSIVVLKRGRDRVA